MSDRGRTPAEKARATRRGLVMADVRGLDGRIAEMLADFDRGIAETAGLYPPEMPPFTGAGGVWRTPDDTFGIVDVVERWVSGHGSTSIPGTYYLAMPNWFNDPWGTWVTSIGAISNILWNANDLRQFIDPLVGSSGKERGRWVPGRVNWEEFEAALALVRPEASVAWNATYGAVPPPPSGIVLDDYEETTFPDVHGDRYAVTLRRPGGMSFSSRQAEWGEWVSIINSSYATLAAARDAFIKSRPALERVKTALHTFRRGSQYSFRGP